MVRQIQARFVCGSITDNGYNLNAAFTAVYGKEGANADYAKATPSGSIQIAIDNETPAAGFFKPRKTYKVTFEEVEE